MLVCGRSIPKPSQVKARFFERDDIVEILAQDVDIDFALKSKLFSLHSPPLFNLISCMFMRHCELVLIDASV